MPKPTPEQMEEFAKWQKEHQGEPVSPEVIKSVIDDDVIEAEDKALRREGYNRVYNAKEIPKTRKREVAE